MVCSRLNNVGGDSCIRSVARRAALQGRSPAGSWRTAYRERAATVLPALGLLALVLLFGVHLPAPVRALIADAAAALEVGR